VPLSQADFGCFRACFCFQSRGADPLRGGGRAPTDPEIKNARPHRSCAYGLAAASPPASPKPNAVGGTQSILFFQGSGGVEFFSLRPLFWRLEVSEQPWERLRRGRRAGGCRTHQRVFVTFQSLQSQSRGGGWSGGAPHLPRLASLAGHLHAIATRGDTGESRRDLEPPRGANKQHARARRLVRAAARRVGGGCVGPCLDEQRDHPLVAPIGSPVQCRFPRWAGRVELLRRERA